MSNEVKKMTPYVCDICGDHIQTGNLYIRSELDDISICNNCSSKLENRTGFCSLSCQFTGHCDESC